MLYLLTSLLNLSTDIDVSCDLRKEKKFNFKPRDTSMKEFFLFFNGIRDFRLGLLSDYASFIQRAGIPVADFRYTYNRVR